MNAKPENSSADAAKLKEISDPFARRLIGKYLANRKQDVGKLTEALSAGDFEAIKITGHNLYGSGATYGLDDISFLGASIERAAIDEDAARIAQLIDEMRDFLHRMKVL